VGRNLPEWMKRQMCGFLHRPERNKTNLVRLAHFLERPANARITRQSLAAIGRPFKGGNRDGHRETSPCRNHRLQSRHAVKANSPRLKTNPFHVRFVRFSDVAIASKFEASQSRLVHAGS